MKENFYKTVGSPYPYSVLWVQPFILMACQRFHSPLLLALALALMLSAAWFCLYVESVNGEKNSRIQLRLISSLFVTCFLASVLLMTVDGVISLVVQKGP